VLFLCPKIFLAKAFGDAMEYSTLQIVVRYTSLDAKNSKKINDHISEKILKGSSI
jgi:hypothetical protein